LVPQRLGHGRHQRRIAAAGERGQFGLARGLLTVAAPLEPQQLGFEALAQGGQAALVGQAEAALQLQEQQVFAHPIAQQRLQLLLQVIQVAGATQLGREWVPAQLAGGQRRGLGGLAARHHHLQHPAAQVAAGAGEAVGLRGAAVPAVAVHLFEAVPVAQGDVVDLPAPGGLDLQQVVGRGRVVVVGIAGQLQIAAGEALHGAVGEHEPRFVGR
jgi:hypothetical protein